MRWLVSPITGCGPVYRQCRGEMKFFKEITEVVGVEPCNPTP
jgi:hypothetical protein